ncbi:hypothetical protein GGTG_13389 [Gaeumannomyces tritici R3-111a-1]|uniref:Uncharacterized protein n=1 Tax=Gaeumannomyces tritici (strain R3-111a-1) TaxID=644352 RepID=J3PIR0_GAET3|nr:hypothetical protein GGTG_13389 [Gaeumannomyces tritici R3-111a-1]EJT68992.1 hypothetical protein GGTG_13389 [Gaeumannomyces tritici R3-111a-1]
MSESTPRSEALQPRSGAAAPLSGSYSMEISARGQCFLLFESLPVEAAGKSGGEQPDTAELVGHFRDASRDYRAQRKPPGRVADRAGVNFVREKMGLDQDVPGGSAGEGETSALIERPNTPAA